MVERDEDSREREQEREQDQAAGILDTIIHGPAEAIVVFDRRCTILAMNEEAERLFGFTEQELRGSHLERVLSIAASRQPPGPGHDGAHPTATGSGGPTGHAVTVAAIGQNRTGAAFPIDLTVLTGAGGARLTAIVRRRPEREAAAEPAFEPREDNSPAGIGMDTSRLLVCEPDAVIGARLKALLETAGFGVDLAPDGGQARRLIASTGYAAMTVDLMLPDQDGLALVRDLRSHPETRDLPVIVVSAKAERGRPRGPERPDLAGGAFGIVDWIQKPGDERRFTETLRHAVDHPGHFRHRVLHVEDDRDLIPWVAAEVGDIALIESATTLGQARLRLASEPFDLVILDLRLPDGSGFELLDDIKKLVPPVPVLLVSATEITPHSGAALAGALVKSRTTNRDLVNAIRSLAASGLPPLRHLPKSLELAAKC